MIPPKTNNIEHKKIVNDIIPPFAERLLSRDRDERVDYRVRYDFLRKFAYFLLSSPEDEIENYLKPFIKDFNGSEGIADLFKEIILAEDGLDAYENFWKIWELFKDKVWKSLRTRDEKKAKTFYKELDARHTLGLLGLSPKQNPLLTDLFKEYLPYCEANRAPRTYRDSELHIRLFLAPALGHIRVMDLTPKHLEDFIGQMRKAGYGSRTIDLRLETLRKILRRAERNRIIPKMPVAIQLIREPRSHPKFVAPAKLETWLSHLSPNHLLRAELSFHTGISDIDLGNLTWDNFNRELRLITYKRPKTKKPIPVPLNERAMEIMTLLETTKEGPYIFKGVRSVRKAYSTASKKSGVKVTPHMLRHTFATSLLSKGIPIEHVSKLLGHGDISTTQIYADVLPEYLRESIAVLNNSTFAPSN